MIVHKIFIEKGIARYECNQAVYPKESKSTLDWKKVTCKNCLNKKPDVSKED